MKIYQARREKLRGPVSSLPAALAGVTQMVQSLEGWWAVVEGLPLCWTNAPSRLLLFPVVQREDRIEFSMIFPIFSDTLKVDTIRIAQYVPSTASLFFQANDMQAILFI